MKNFKSLFAGALCAGVVACGSTLVWQSTYQIDQPTLGYSLGTDGSNNSYVGGGVRSDTPDEWTPNYNALLLKYGESGNLLWEAQIPSSSFINDISPLPNGNLVVSAQAVVNYGFMKEEGKTSDLWLVSGEDGTVVTQLDTFEDEVLQEVLTSESAVYVISTIPLTFDLCLFGCEVTDYHSTLTAYDFDGGVINEFVFSDQPSLDITRGDNGTLLLAHSAKHIKKFDADLNLLWAITDDIEPQLSECISAFSNLQASPNGDFWIVCADEVLQLDASGKVQSTTELSGYLAEYTNAEGETISVDYWGGGDSYTDVDAQGNLYLARARNTAYIDSQVGGLDGLYITEPSTLESDVVLIKIAADTGEVLWSDDINTAMFGADTRLVTYYYYPMAMEVHDQDVYLTFRGFKGRYKGYNDTSSACNIASDWFFPFNSCELDESLDVYAKTFRYDGSTGSRKTQTRHDIAYPRAVRYNANAEVVIVGDDNPDVIYSASLTEAFARGINGTSDDNGFVEHSDLRVEKHKL